MSFVLPGNARSLRFTGEAKALAPDSHPGGLGVGEGGAPPSTRGGGAMSLGKPRVRKATSPGRMVLRSPSLAPASGRDLHHPEHRPEVVSTPYTHPSHAPVMRNKLEHTLSDEVTTALGREDVLPGAIRPQKPVVLPNAPAIPHFRTHAADPPVATVPSYVLDQEPEKRGASYAVWIAASIIAGVLSYHVAPALMGAFAAPAAVQPSEAP